MNEKYFFADADTPFHVWVRERGAHGYRWVLRHASQVIELAGSSLPTREAAAQLPGARSRAA